MNNEATEEEQKVEEQYFSDDSDLEINYDQLNADCEINDLDEALSVDSERHEQPVSCPLPTLTSNCQKHSKPLEAFCPLDGSVLCVSCILEDGYQSKTLLSLK